MTKKWRKRRKRNPWFDDSDYIGKCKKNSYPHVFRENLGRNNKRYPYIRIIKPRKTYRRSPFQKEPEPLIDILEDGEIITVVAALPCFRKEDVNLHIKDNRLIISASTMDKRYYKSLKLPAEVESKPIYSSFKNGVLELRFKKLLEKKMLIKSEG